jgi:hypothetical protein
MKQITLRSCLFYKTAHRCKPELFYFLLYLSPSYREYKQVIFSTSLRLLLFDDKHRILFLYISGIMSRYNSMINRVCNFYISGCGSKFFIPIMVQTISLPIQPIFIFYKGLSKENDLGFSVIKSFSIIDLNFFLL